MERSPQSDEMIDTWKREFFERTGMVVAFVDEDRGEVVTGQRKTSVLARIEEIDVAAVDLIHVGELAEHLLPFNHGEFRQKLFDQETLADFEQHWTGEQLAIPFYKDYGMFFYRRDLLAKYGIPEPGPEGWTFDEMEAIAYEVQEGERAAGSTNFQGFVWMGQKYEGLTCMALEVAASHGDEPLIDERGGVAVDNPSLQQALRRMSRWIWGPRNNVTGVAGPISSSDVLSFRESDVRRSFCERGEAMFATHWPSFVADCNSEGMAGRFGVVRNPGLFRGRGRGILGGSALVIPKHTAHLREALVFVEMATSREWQLRHWEVTRRISVRRDLAPDTALCANETARSCRIDLSDLAGDGVEIRIPGSTGLHSVIVSVDSGRCHHMGPVATICDVDPRNYTVVRPSTLAGASYAAVSEAFLDAFHDALLNVPQEEEIAVYVKRAACAVVDARRLWLLQSPTDGARFWSRTADGNNQPQCDFEILHCAHGYTEDMLECRSCITLWTWGDTCADAFIFVSAVIFVIVPALMVYLCILRAHRQADSIWKVRRDELTFGDPKEVLGRGTFGLVLKAEYRGTAVAVKRVMPPAAQQFDDFGTCADLRARRIVPPGATPRSLMTITSRKGSKMENHPSEGSIDSMSMHLSDTLRACCRCGLRRRLHVLIWGEASTQHASLKQDFIKEMRTLSMLRHPCVLTVMGAVISKKSEEPMLVMELMHYGSLHDFLHNETVVTEDELVLPILRDIIQGLRFLHAAQPCIVHGDLKSHNVLVDSKFRAKVADFGLSQKAKVGGCGTPMWMAPELLRGGSNTPASDVYAFGITLNEVYSRRDPYQDEEWGDVRDVLVAVADPEQQKRPTIPACCSREVEVLMRDCWHHDPALRPPCEEIERRLRVLDPGMTMYPARRTQAVDSPRLARGQTQDLLHDVFPRHIADALRAGRKVEPEHKDMVTIFFSDIVGFTDISATLEPEKVSRMLDRLYSKFDHLSEEHCVFKVETIGDAYMAVANLVENQEHDHAKRIALFAKAAVEAANSTFIDESDPDRGCVSIRVGFHSGPVVASVVGTRNLRYCLFGDTVNTASRMESTSQKNRIHCSKAAADILKEQAKEIPVSARGLIPIKGKGDMFTYWAHETPGAEAAYAEASPSVRSDWLFGRWAT